MFKRGQITVLIIISIVVLIGFGMLLVVKTSVISNVPTKTITSLDSTSIKNYRAACLETKVLEGIDYFGLMPESAPKIESYIESRLKDCASFDEFGKDLTVETGDIDVRVIIGEDTVAVDVSYPVTIKTPAEELSFSDFNYYMPKESKAKLGLDSNGETKKNISIVSEDRDAELIIPAGTRITDSDGNPLDELSIKVLERHFNGLNNNAIVGMVAYEGIPSGARFDPPVVFELTYDPSEIPQGVREETLSIGWYDQERGFWWGLPTTVDTIRHKMRAQLSHFTSVGNVDCKTKQQEGAYTLPIDPEENARDITQIDGLYSNIAKNPGYDPNDPSTWYYIYTLNYKPLYEQTCGKSYPLGDCLIPPVDEWGTQGPGWHEFAVKGKQPLLTSGPNPPLSTMQRYILCSEQPKDWDEDDSNPSGNAGCRGKLCYDNCVKKAKAGIGDEYINNDGIKDNGGCSCVQESYEDCSGTPPCSTKYRDTAVCDSVDKATPMTYGYPGKTDQTAPEGYGVITFKIAESGNGCVMKKKVNNDEAELLLKVKCSNADKCNNLLGDGTIFYEVPPADVLINPDFSAPPDSFGPTSLKQGENKIYIKMENLNNDGCIWAEALLEIKGLGVTWQAMDCTVQEAINAMCRDGAGNGYPEYPNCEGGFHKHGDVLNGLISAARARSPDGWRKLKVGSVYPDASLWCKGGSATPGNTCSAVGGDCVDLQSCNEDNGKQVVAGECSESGKVCCKNKNSCPANWCKQSCEETEEEVNKACTDTNDKCCKPTGACAEGICKPECAPTSEVDVGDCKILLGFRDGVCCKPAGCSDGASCKETCDDVLEIDTDDSCLNPVAGGVAFHCCKPKYTCPNPSWCKDSCDISSEMDTGDSCPTPQAGNPYQCCKPKRCPNDYICEPEGSCNADVEDIDGKCNHPAGMPGDCCKCKLGAARCGHSCCPGDFICMNPTTGQCSPCPAGQTKCGNACYGCSAGQTSCCFNNVMQECCDSDEVCDPSVGCVPETHCADGTCFAGTCGAGLIPTGASCNTHYVQNGICCKHCFTGTCNCPAELPLRCGEGCYSNCDAGKTPCCVTASGSFFCCDQDATCNPVYGCTYS